MNKARTLVLVDYWVVACCGKWRECDARFHEAALRDVESLTTNLNRALWQLAEAMRRLKA